MRTDLNPVSQELSRLDSIREQLWKNNREYWPHLKNAEDFKWVYQMPMEQRLPLEELYGKGRDFAVFMASVLEDYQHVDQFPTFSSYVHHLSVWLQKCIPEFRQVLSDAIKTKQELQHVPWAVQEMIKLHEGQLRMADSLLGWVEMAKQTSLYRMENLPNKIESDSVHQRRLVITVHGIRTKEDQLWQRGLEDRTRIQGNAHRMFEIESRYYGFLPAITFLLPWVRERKVKWFQKEWARTKDRHGRIPSVVAHSFGTYLVAETMRKYPEVCFERIVFCGAIVQTSYPWEEVRERGQVKEVLNQFGGVDFWAGIVQWLVSDAGPAGRTGFEVSDETREFLFQESHPEWNHGDYFYAGNYDRWLTFLEGKALPVHKPLPRATRNWRPLLILILAGLVAWYFLRKKDDVWQFFPWVKNGSQHSVNREPLSKQVLVNEKFSEVEDSTVRFIQTTSQDGSTRFGRAVNFEFTVPPPPRAPYRIRACRFIFKLSPRNEKQTDGALGIAAGKVSFQTVEITLRPGTSDPIQSKWYIDGLKHTFIRGRPTNNPSSDWSSFELLPKIPPITADPPNGEVIEGQITLQENGECEFYFEIETGQSDTPTILRTRTYELVH